MNDLIKITHDEDGDLVEDQTWCALAFGGDTSRLLCSGEAIDGSNEILYKEKTVKKGGITCQDCIDTIKHYKSINL